PRDGPPRAGGWRHLQGHVLRLVLPRRQRVQDRVAAGRRPLPGSPDPRAAMVGGGELLLPAEPIPAGARAPVRREPELLRAGALPQRGPRLAARGTARLLREPSRDQLGHSIPRRPWPSDLRLVRRADQLRYRGRVPGRPGCLRTVVAGGRT